MRSKRGLMKFQQFHTEISGVIIYTFYVTQLMQNIRVLFYI